LNDAEAVAAIAEPGNKFLSTVPISIPTEHINDVRSAEQDEATMISPTENNDVVVAAVTCMYIYGGRTTDTTVSLKIISSWRSEICTETANEHKCSCDEEDNRYMMWCFDCKGWTHCSCTSLNPLHACSLDIFKSQVYVPKECSYL
jgi:hypothetical protein